MKVSLINYTGAGFPDPAKEAAAQIVFTKQTRLTMTPGLLDEIRAWPKPRLHEELVYISNTIPSSWEFCDYTFLVEGASRGYTHQSVRTRTASFAQQTMRVLDVSQGRGWDYYKGPSLVPGSQAESVYDHTMQIIGEAYKSMIAAGAKIEDARGVLPTNITTNLVIKMNMRTFVETMRKRASSRTQGEYREALDGMYAAVRAVHPWINLFCERTFEKAAAELEGMILALDPLTVYPELKTHMIKLLDQMRSNS